MVDMTNMYALQQGDLSFKNTNEKEIKIFIGLHLATGVIKLPRIKMYWSKTFGIALFQNSMTKNRFFKIRNYLHLVNNLELNMENTDKFKKVRPLLDSVLARCQALTKEKRVCIDEQMIPFKGHHSARQFNPKKPVRWGLKVFLLCGESGLVYDFIIYQGKSTGLNPSNLSDYGLGPSVVLHLAENISPGSELYIDNWFVTYHLIQALKLKKIFAAGTAQVGRFSNPPFMPLAEMQAKGRGTMQEVVSSDKDVVMTRWFDNKPVNMVSNFIGVGNPDTATRWDKNEKKFIDIDRPEVIRLYNCSMGGVDKTDFLVAIYRTFIRSRKWTLRVIFHFIDLTITNSWLEYKRDCYLCNINKNKIMDLLDFRMSIVTNLVEVGRTVESPGRKRGRPSSADTEGLQPHKAPKTFETRPSAAVKLDTVDHLPVHSGKKEAGRCKENGCKGKSHFRCLKCEVYLCLSKDRNCFLKFHK